MEDFITLEIIRFVREYQDSSSLSTFWNQPLVSFADASDPLFRKLKEAVSPSHALPHDLLDDAQSVIVYFLPFQQEIPQSNKKGRHASRAWALAYIETNQLIVEINQHLGEVLDEKGFRTKLLPPTHNFDTEKLISDWSHRHVAYIAGLGKFGLHKLLITERGCCGRFGSLVTNVPLKASERSDAEMCLFHAQGVCKLCVKNCVTGALTTEGFDRHSCYQLLLENVELYETDGYADVCGKCISMVPCSFVNPVKKETH